MSGDLRANICPCVHRRMLNLICWVVVACWFAPFPCLADTELSNAALVVRIDSSDGSYSISAKGGVSPAIRSGVAVELDHHWIKSATYPKHEIADSDFEDTLGRGRQATVRATGLADQPEISYTIRVYETRPFGEI